jgi:acetyl esterase/lipase
VIYLCHACSDHEIVDGNGRDSQRAQAAGAAVQVEVFSSMWHDFVQESEGCGSWAVLEEGKQAIEVPLLPATIGIAVVNWCS